MPANLENSPVATGLEKVSFHSNPYKGNAKECSNYHTIAVISHASKVMLKILQARLQQYVNRELPDVQAGFRKGRGTRAQLPTSTVYVCYVFFIHLSVDGHLSYFHMLAIVNSAAVNIGVFVSV